MGEMSDDKAWKVHRFEVWGGELVCRVEALRCGDGGQLLLWVGGGGKEARLGDVALGMPGGAATALLGGSEQAAALARRLAARLRRPVFVCCGAALDRLTAPLLERALVNEIKSRPDFFHSEIK